MPSFSLRHTCLKETDLWPVLSWDSLFFLSLKCMSFWKHYLYSLFSLICHPLHPSSFAIYLLTLPVCWNCILQGQQFTSGNPIHWPSLSFYLLPSLWGIWHHTHLEIRISLDFMALVTLCAPWLPFLLPHLSHLPGSSLTLLSSLMWFHAFSPILIPKQYAKYLNF